MPRYERRVSLRTLLLVLVPGMLMASGLSVAFVIYYNTFKSLSEIVESLFDQVASRTASEVRHRVEPALRVMHEVTGKASSGLWEVDGDDVVFGRRLAERLRYETTLDWISYGDESGRFIGAVRRPDGSLQISRSWVTPEGGRMSDEAIAPDGTRKLVREESPWKYDPRKRPWYPKARDSNGPVWMEPYDWWDQEGLGITCTSALRIDGKFKGAFTADLRIAEISRFLGTLRIGERGQAFIVTREGKLIAAASGPVGDKVPPPRILVEALEALKKQGGATKVTEQSSTIVGFIVDDEGYIAGFKSIHVDGGLDWITAIVVPEDEFLAGTQRYLRVALGIVVVSLALSALLAAIMASRFGARLREISDDLERIGAFDLTPRPSIDSRIKEIAVLAQATEQMRTGLRSFARYVPTDIVREMLESGLDAKPGVQPRVLTICFADIDDFTHSTAPLDNNRLVGQMAEYLRIMTDSLAAHGGTLDKFVGDGVVAFFNAPLKVEMHARQACLWALDVQNRLAAARARWEQAGGPPFRTRIGLHTAEVLVGNIGTEERLNYTVLGYGVNLAARLEELNKTYGTRVLATAQTRDAAASGFEWRRLDRVVLRGASEASDVYELLGVRGCVDAAVLEARDIYGVAFAAYLNRRFDETATLCDRVLTLVPNDHAAPVLRERALLLAIDPPHEGWTGAYSATD